MKCYPDIRFQQLLKPYTDNNDAKKVIVESGNAKIAVTSLDEEKQTTYYVSGVDVINLAINSFTLNPSLVVKGRTINDIVLDWAYNKAVNTQSITASGVTIPSINSVVRTLTINNAGVQANKVFTLTGTDDFSTVNANRTLSFGNYIYVRKGQYYDSTTPTATLVNFITGATDKRIQTNGLGSFSCTSVADEHEYYASPVTYGQLLFKSDTAITFGGVILLGTYSIQNEFGYSEPYYIYRTLNDFQLGQNYQVTAA